MSDLKKTKKTVMVEMCHTHCINGMDPIEMEEEAVGSLYQLDHDTDIMAFDTTLDGKKVTTTIKVAHGVLSIVRIGEVHSRQTFAANEWYASQYFYGGGSVICRNFTKKFDYALTPEGGVVDVLYELWSGETHLGFFNFECFIH